MELTRPVVTARAKEYREQEALYTVEQEQIETLPGAFAAGEFGRRDAEWVVRWYYRRFLGGYPDADRRAVEERFAGADFELVRDAIAEAVAADDDAAGLGALTRLPGVDVPVASAFLMFIDPEERVVLGEREWTVLRDAGELTGTYPEAPSVADYERYVGTCRTLAASFDCDMWTLYRALWRLWKANHDAD